MKKHQTNPEWKTFYKQLAKMLQSSLGDWSGFQMTKNMQYNNLDCILDCFFLIIKENLEHSGYFEYILDIRWYCWIVINFLRCDNGMMVQKKDVFRRSWRRIQGRNVTVSTTYFQMVQPKKQHAYVRKENT